MKKTTKSVLLVLAAIFLIAAGTGLYFASPILAMKPVKTGQVFGADGTLPLIYALRSGRGAVYFLDTGDGFLAIDAGTNVRKVEASMRELGIGPAQVKWVLLTHSDGDHVAGLPLFPNAEIYMGENELGLLDGTVERSRSGKNKLPDDIDLDTIRFLSDGEELVFGNVRLECISVPGHTPGSMAYLVNASYIFTGDAFVNNTEKIHPFTMDEAQAKDTLWKLGGIIIKPDITVLTSHYGIFTPPENLPNLYP